MKRRDGSTEESWAAARIPLEGAGVWRCGRSPPSGATAAHDAEAEMSSRSAKADVAGRSPPLLALAGVALLLGFRGGYAGRRSPPAQTAGGRSSGPLQEPRWRLGNGSLDAGIAGSEPPRQRADLSSSGARSDADSRRTIAAISREAVSCTLMPAAPPPRRRDTATSSGATSAARSPRRRGAWPQVYTAVYVRRRGVPPQVRHQAAAPRSWRARRRWSINSSTRPTWASSMVHSNIVPVFDFGKVGDEYSHRPGIHSRRDLARFYQAVHAGADGRRRARLPRCSTSPSETLQGAGIRAHQDQMEWRAGCSAIVHRDVSPTNILVSARGEVKLFDFRHQ